MADFFGRWSCARAPLSSADRDATRAWSALAAFAARMDNATSTREEVRLERLWLSAPEASLTRHDAGVLQAHIGFLTEPRQIPNPAYERGLFARKLV